jgi:hypothetical protein
MAHRMRKRLSPARGTIAIGGLALAVQLSIAGLLSASDAWADADGGNLHSLTGAVRDHLGASLERRSHEPGTADTGNTQSTAGSSPATAAGGNAGVSSAAGSEASASVTAGSNANVQVRSRSTTRTIDRGNVSITISISRAVAIVDESGGTVIGRAVDKSVAIAVDSAGQDSVTVRSLSKATIRSAGIVSGVSMNVAADGSAEAAITGGPSASAVSSAEASIGL